MLPTALYRSGDTARSTSRIMIRSRTKALTAIANSYKTDQDTLCKLTLPYWFHLQSSHSRKHVQCICHKPITPSVAALISTQDHRKHIKWFQQPCSTLTSKQDIPTWGELKSRRGESSVSYKLVLPQIAFLLCMKYLPSVF